MAEDKRREGSSSDVPRGAPLFARIAASIHKWPPALHMVPVTGLQGTSNVMHGTHPVDARKPTQRHRQGKNKDSFWLPWGLWDSMELNGALLFLKAHTGLWVVYGQVWRSFLSTVVHSITFAQFRVKVIWFQTWAFYSHMLTSAQGTSQTADAMLWSIYSLRTCVRVWSLYLKFNKYTSTILSQVPRNRKLNIYPLFTNRGQIQFIVFFMIFEHCSRLAPEQNKKKCIIP